MLLWGLVCAALASFFALGFALAWFIGRQRRVETAARRAETKADELEARALANSQLIQSAIDAIDDPFWIYDGENRLVHFNAAFRKLTADLGCAIAVGMHFKDIYAAITGHLSFPSEQDRKHKESLRSASGAANVQTTLKDGRLFAIRKRVLPNHYQVYIGFDRTADEQRQLALEDARHAAENANRAKTEFLTSMSHELRTPMNAVLGFAQLMARDEKTPLSDKHRGMVDEVLESGKHLLSLIDDVLDLARIESESVELTLEPLSLDKAIAKALATLQPVAERAQVKLTADRGAPAVVNADRRRLQQLLLNLTSNAVKYNHAGGKVSLTTQVTASSARVCVLDDGMGVPEAARHKLFQPFQRGGRETGPIKGTGIGLTVTLRIAELMGGRVGYEPRDPGSLFWFELPLAHATPVETALHSAPRLVAATPRLRGKLLYVEDNPANVQLLKAFVATHPGLHLVSASSAEQGLVLAAEACPDLLLVDVNLPGMSGLEALPHFRQLPGLSWKPAVAISASAFVNDRATALAAGFDAYLSKPLAFDELERLLERLLPAQISRAVPQRTAQAE